MRIYELAKELGIPTKEFMQKLHELGIPASNHMETLSVSNVAKVRASLHGSTAEQAASATKAEPAPPQPTEAAASSAAGVSLAAPAEPAKKVLVLRGPMTVRELAEQLGMKPNQLIAQLMTMNVFASINEKLDVRVIQQVAQQRGFTVEQEKKPEPPPPPPPKPKAVAQEPKKEEWITRPPVVTFMGHVDHGKTSLLDYIRRTKVAQNEDGGITQHIGAYMVTYNDRMITFLDTPGHAAFTAMRARGATLADLAVIVIAADDGVMPQTEEALQHAKAAGVCIMVAINKIDLRTANVDRVKRQLQQRGLTPEDWGGDVICCPVSATTGEGIDHFLEMILLQAEMLELKANVRGRAKGFVVEAQLEPGRGPTATLLVKSGTLQVGDALVCGHCWGRVRALINDRGIKVRTAGPSFAVRCLGLNAVPEPGMEFAVCANDREARELAAAQEQQRRLQAITVPRRASLEDLLKPQDGSAPRELAIVLKTDVQGSLEAIQQALGGIRSEKVKLHIILSGVGNVTENDVLLGSASRAIVVGFHVSTEPGAAALAKREGVEIRLYSVIYELLDDIRDAMVGLLEPIVKQQIIGHAEVRQVFELSKKGRVAGCMVTDGRVTSRARARVLRDHEVIFEGTVASLKRFQNDASEVREGQECGMRLDNFQDYQVGDVIELYEIEKIQPSL